MVAISFQPIFGDLCDIMYNFIVWMEFVGEAQWAPSSSIAPGAVSPTLVYLRFLHSLHPKSRPLTSPLLLDHISDVTGVI